MSYPPVVNGMKGVREDRCFTCHMALLPAGHA